jgi:hypothetical protein
VKNELGVLWGRGRRGVFGKATQETLWEAAVAFVHVGAFQELHKADLGTEEINRLVAFAVAKPERLEVIGVAIPEINLWGPKEQNANGA